MRIDEICQRYDIHFTRGKWYINDQEVNNDDAKLINKRIADLRGTVNRFDVTKRVNDYLHAAYDVAKSKAAGTFE